jgi:hypothetical protein
MTGLITIADRTWYHFMLPPAQGKTTGLFEDFPRELCAKQHLICLHTQEFGRLYSLFPTVKEVYEYQKKFNLQYRSFLEIIPGETPQKQHYDIDISPDKLALFGMPNDLIEILNNNDIKNAKAQEATVALDEIAKQTIDLLVKAINKVYLELNIKLQQSNISIYTSHSFSKRSFHVIIQGYYHRSNENCKYLYHRTMSHFGDRSAGYQNIIDPKVYSSLQQFRLLYSQKPNSGRPKILTTGTVNAKDSEHQATTGCLEFHLLCQSMIAYTKDCVLVETPLTNSKPKRIADGDLTHQQIDEALKCAITAGVTTATFEVYKVESCLISLKRRMPSYCRLCRRIHDNDNAFIIVNEGGVFFYCHRNTKVPLHCGTVALASNIASCDEDLLDVDPSDLPQFIIGDEIITLGGQDVKSSPSKIRDSKDTKHISDTPGDKIIDQQIQKVGSSFNKDAIIDTKQVFNGHAVPKDINNSDNPIDVITAMTGMAGNPNKLIQSATDQERERNREINDRRKLKDRVKGLNQGKSSLVKVGW